MAVSDIGRHICKAYHTGCASPPELVLAYELKPAQSRRCALLIMGSFPKRQKKEKIRSHGGVFDIVESSPEKKSSLPIASVIAKKRSSAVDRSTPWIGNATRYYLGITDRHWACSWWTGPVIMPNRAGIISYGQIGDIMNLTGSIPSKRP